MKRTVLNLTNCLVCKHAPFFSFLSLSMAHFPPSTVHVCSTCAYSTSSLWETTFKREENDEKTAKADESSKNVFVCPAYLCLFFFLSSFPLVRCLSHALSPWLQPTSPSVSPLLLTARADRNTLSLSLLSLLTLLRRFHCAFRSLSLSLSLL